MKKIILIFSLLVISYNCKAQINTINSSESTINGVAFLGNDVTLVTQHFGQPNSVEDYYFEMDDVMSQKYNYNGLLFTIINNKVYSFEITGSSYDFTKNNINIGNNIETLQTNFPQSFTNRTNNSITIRFNNIDRFIIIFFNSINQITMIRLGSY